MLVQLMPILFFQYGNAIHHFQRIDFPVQRVQYFIHPCVRFAAGIYEKIAALYFQNVLSSRFVRVALASRRQEHSNLPGASQDLS